MEAVFLKLVNMSLTASWLVLAVLILRVLLKNAPKYIRVILWGFVGIRLIFPFSLESMFSMIPSSEPLPEEFLYAAAPQVNTGIPVLNNAINPVITQSMAPDIGASANPTQIWSFIFTQVWILGMILMVLYAAVSYYLVYRRVAASIRIGDNLRLCDHIESPFILGIIRPQIYLPSEIDPKTADLVLAHEYAHLKRKDHWWKPLGFALLCVYWFNPVMWLAYVLLCRDIELACDEKVIQELGAEDKKAYSTALLRCSVNRKMIAACPLAFGEVGVKDRIKTVLNYKKPAFWVIVAAVMICVVVAVCFLTDPLNTVDPMSLDDWGISITAQDPSPTGVTLAYSLPKIKDGEFTIPLNQTLLQLKDGEWIEVLTVIEEDEMPDWIKWLYADDEASYQRLEWNTAYGALEPGAYQIKKTIWLHQDGLSFQKDFYADFVIPPSKDSAQLQDAVIYEYKQNETHIRMVFFPAVIQISAKDTIFQSIDEIFDNLTILDQFGNPISTRGTYGGSQGSTLITMEVIPDTPISMEQIGSIYIGNYRLSRVGDSSGEDVQSSGEITKLYPNAIRDVWVNGREDLAPYIYISPVTGVEYSRLCRLDHAIRSIIISENMPIDRADGAWLESHVILGEDTTCGMTENGVFLGRTTLYVLSQLCEVEEKDGQVEVISRWLIPAVLTFDETYEHAFALREYWQSGDGAWDMEMLKDHFPESVTDTMMQPEHYQVQFDNDIHIQGIFYFDVLPRASVTDLLTVIAAYHQYFTFHLIQDGTNADNFNPWAARNSYQYSSALAEYELEPISDYSPEDQNSPMIQMRLTIDDKTVELSFFEESDIVTLYQRNKLTAYRAIWPWGDQPIGTIVRSWFDEAELFEHRFNNVPIVDIGQGYEEATQEYCNNYFATHLGVTEGSSFRYNFVKVDTSVDMEATNLARTRGELDENGYAFWVTVYFVPENDRALQNAWAGNTHEYTGDDPTIPEGAFVYTRCGYIRLTEYGWVGEIVGTCF